MTEETRGITAESKDLFARKQEELALEEQKQKLKEGLPHLYGWPWYAWAKEYFDSTNRLNFLCAANQISKSSTQIRKCIDWATNTKKWPLLWRSRPRQFWYLYPDKTTLTIEWETKWAEFMPSGEFKNHPVYGWRDEWKDGAPFAIHFNSGVIVYFRTYAMKTANMQGGSVHAIFCDEELPEEHLNELMMRISATQGYFHMCFTATLGQEIWRKTVEPETDEEEVYKSAFKLQVSLFECMNYIDGSPSPWTKERINEQIALCSTEQEVQKRIYGRFIVIGGRKYESFLRKNNVKPAPADLAKILREWHLYGAADYGSGGEEGHPAGIVMMAVRPDYRKGIVFRCWRGDKIQTTAGDVVQKFLDLQGNLIFSSRFYDQGCKDFDTIATSMGETFLPSEKGHDIGEKVVNDLFKNGMLDLIEGDPEIEKLASELSTLKKTTKKNKAKDNLADPLRYTSVGIPWDFSGAIGKPSEEELEAKRAQEPDPTEEDLRRAGFEPLTQEQEAEAAMMAEFTEWNDLYAGN